MDRFRSFVDTLNHATNLLAVCVIISGVVLVVRGHPEPGIIMGAFAVFNASSKKSQENQ